MRFVFCVIVILFHAYGAFFGGDANTDPGRWALFPHGNMGVEFFFLVSGYLMAVSVARKDVPASGRELADDTQSFVLNKVRALWPYHVITFVGSFVTSLLVAPRGLLATFGTALKAILKAIPSLFFVQMFGFKDVNPNGVEWYISVMLMAMVVMYPIMRRHFHMFVKVIAPFFALAVLGIMYKVIGQFSGVVYWEGLAFRSTYRGFAEIALGVALFGLVQRLDAVELSLAGRRALTACQAAAMLVVPVCLCLKVDGHYELQFLMGMCVIVTLSFSRHSLLNDALASPVVDWLGRFSMPLYLSQVCALNLMKAYGGGLDPWVQASLTLGISVVIGLAVQAMGNAWVRRRAMRCAGA